jgi:Ankyrin repeat
MHVHSYILVHTLHCNHYTVYIMRTVWTALHTCYTYTDLSYAYICSYVHTYVCHTVQNKDGWTALHTCCHSNTTAHAGLEILKEFIRRGGDIDVKTKRGPGSYNRYIRHTLYGEYIQYMYILYTVYTLYYTLHLWSNQ